MYGGRLCSVLVCLFVVTGSTIPVHCRLMSLSNQISEGLIGVKRESYVLEGVLGDKELGHDKVFKMAVDSARRMGKMATGQPGSEWARSCWLWP